MPAPPKLPGQIGPYIAKNARFAYGGGPLGGLFLAGDIKGIFDADNKLKALLKTAKDFVLIRVGMAAVFTAVAGAVKALVRETGSLEAALKRLKQIQDYSRQFSLFAGGVNAAKQRIVELQALSKRGPFKFEDIVEANKSLEIFTRGAYSSVVATKEVGQAAIASGNNIQDTARAVGVLYDNLRAGRPIDEAAEQLRQMGIITQGTADELTGLAKTGADTSVVFGELTRALGQSQSATEGYKEELSGIEEAHAKAVEELKIKFGAPFAANEIQNIQNTTAAMQAITPVVGNIATLLGGLYNAFSTGGSYIIKFAAQSKIAQVALEVLSVALVAATVAAVAFGTGAALPLTAYLYNLQISFLGTSAAAVAFTTAIRALAIASVWGLLVGGIVSLVGATYNLIQSDLNAEKAIRKKQRATDEATAAIAAQIGAVSTLTEKQEAQVKAIQAVLDAEKDLADLRKKQEERKPPARVGRGEMAGETYGPDYSNQIKKQEQVVKNRKALSEENARASGLDSERVEALVRAEEETKAQYDQEQKGVALRERDARAGLEAGRTLQNNRAEIDGEIASRKQALAIARDEFETRKKTAEAQGTDLPGKEVKKKKADFARQEREITELEKTRQEMGLQVPNKESAAFLQTQVEQLEHAKALNSAQKELNTLVEAGAAPRDITAARAKVARETQMAGGQVWTPEKMAVAKARYDIAKAEEARVPELAVERRRSDAAEFGIRTEIRGHEARRRGDIEGAQAQEDIQKFSQNFMELLPALGEHRAKSLALAKTQDEISEQYGDAQRVVSSMTAVGGGGGVSGVNPQLESAKRREALQQEMVKLLEILTGGAPEGAGGTSTFGQ